MRHLPFPPFPFKHLDAAARALLLASTTFIVGCASKQPVPQAPSTVVQPAATNTENAQASTTDGVQTIKQKRFLGFLRPYRPDIQQGNFITQEMVAGLKPGMSPEQVVFLLGTPLLTDIFHVNRWDYLFRLQKGNGDITTSRVTVHFKDNKVSHFEGGNNLPTEQDYLDRIAEKAKARKK